MRKNRKLVFIFALIIFMFSQLVYILTLSPTVNFIDSGELITVCHKLGIAHPTGYPLYTLLGRLFSFFPSGNGAVRINYMSSIFASLCGIFIYFAVLTIISILRKSTDIHINEIIVAYVSGLFTCFSLTLWQQAVVTEVYSLTAFIFSFLILIIFIWYSRISENKKADILLAVFFYFLGLGFGNHLSLVHIVPATIFFLLSARKIKIRTFVYCGFFFVLGISIYLYLPVRSSLNPVMDWGNPDNFTRFINHITGKQYRVWMFSSSPAVLKEHILNYVTLLSKQISPFLLI